MSRKTPNGPSRPDKNAERDAKGLQKKARLESDLEEGLEERLPILLLRASPEYE